MEIQQAVSEIDSKTDIETAAVTGEIRPIIVHVHIPKTAGTSFTELLRRQFEERHFSYLHPDPTYVITPEQFDDLLIKKPSLESFSSHCVRTFPPRIAGRNALYITFLREPAAAFLSLLSYTRKEYNNLSDAAKQGWPDNTPELSLRELAYRYLAPCGPYGQSCLQTRFLCHPSYTKLLITPDYNQFGINSYHAARSNLRRFFFVGIVEQMQRSLQWLKEKLSMLGVDFDISDIPQANRIDSSGEDLSWLNEGDPVGKLVIRSNANDYRLYREWKSALETGTRDENNGALDRSSSYFASTGTTDFDISSEWTPENVLRAFSSWEYQRINARRLEHVASLGLRWSGRSVWEVSAGIGDLTCFFLDRSCSVVVSDVRTESLEILSERYSFLEVKRFDFDEAGCAMPNAFDCVFCYGALYHSSNPSLAISQMASRCKDLLLLECCVSYGDDLRVNPIEEDRSHPTQSFHGIGCRPTRRWLFETLKAHFEFVYCPLVQPNHEQFPTDWTTNENGGGLIRAVLIASRHPLHNPLLQEGLLEKQLRVG
jgi:hypothetical protein